MLMLGRKLGEEIVIAGDVTLKVLSVQKFSATILLIFKGGAVLRTTLYSPLRYLRREVR